MRGEKSGKDSEEVVLKLHHCIGGYGKRHDIYSKEQIKIVGQIDDPKISHYIINVSRYPYNGEKKTLKIPSP